MRDSGISDFEAYFQDHPEAVRRCAALVKVLDVNRATLELYQARDRKIFLKGLGSFFSQESYGAFREELLAVSRHQRTCATETIARSLRGEIRHLVVKRSLARGYEDTWARVIVSMMDITPLRRAEAELHRLSGRLLDLQDAEQRRIARELHDGTAQNLAVVEMNLSWLNESAAALEPNARKALSESIALVKDCSREIRTLSYLLHPPMLDEMGLASALRWFTERFAERSGIRVDLDLPSDLGRLPQRLETTLFRIVQESLTNIYRHSGSRRARIQISRSPTAVASQVTDAGRGMPRKQKESTREGEMSGGVGVAGMRERARQVGGRLEICSGPSGTTVKAILPLVGTDS